MVIYRRCARRQSAARRSFDFSNWHVGSVSRKEQSMSDDDRQRLLEVQHRLAELTREQHRLEGERDSLLRLQLDADGLRDRQPNPVR